MCLHRLWERRIGYEPKILSSIYLNNNTDNGNFYSAHPSGPKRFTMTMRRNPNHKQRHNQRVRLPTVTTYQTYLRNSLETEKVTSTHVLS